MLSCCRVVPVLALAAGAIADPPVPMSRIAPPQAFLVAEIADFSALRLAAEGSALGDLWRDPKVQDFVEHATRDMLEDIADDLARINAKPEDLKPPTGRVGFALFMPDDAAEAEPEPFGTPHFLIVSDFGENADAWRDLISRELDRLRTAGEIETVDDDHDGVPLTVVKYVQQEDGEEGGPAIGDELFVAWAGDTLCFTTARSAAESGLDALSGREVDAVQGNESFARSLRQHPADPLAYAVVLFAPLAADFRASMREGMIVPIDPGSLAAALGVDRIESLSMGLRSVGGAGELAEMTTAALVPEKHGLVALFTDPLGGFEPPAFVGPDCASAIAFNFRFHGLLDALRAVVNALPENERAQALPAFEQGAAMLGPALAAIGPRVEYFVSYDRPLEPDSPRQVFAIQVRDQLPVSNTLALFSQQAGLESRDFEGNTIYFREGFPFAVGLGFGHVFVGQAAGVENAMRAASNPEAPRLATEPAFRNAAAAVPREAVMASYTDLRREIQWLYYTLQNIEAIQAASLEGLELTPEQKDEILAELRQQQAVPEWTAHLPPIESLTGRLGFTVSDIRPTPDGFFGRTLLLRPE